MYVINIREIIFCATEKYIPTPCYKDVINMEMPAEIYSEAVFPVMKALGFLLVPRAFRMLGNWDGGEN